MVKDPDSDYLGNSQSQLPNSTKSSGSGGDNDTYNQFGDGDSDGVY